MFAHRTSVWMQMLWEWFQSTNEFNSTKEMLEFIGFISIANADHTWMREGSYS